MWRDVAPRGGSEGLSHHDMRFNLIVVFLSEESFTDKQPNAKSCQFFLAIKKFSVPAFWWYRRDTEEWECEGGLWGPILSHL